MQLRPIRFIVVLVLSLAFVVRAAPAPDDRPLLGFDSSSAAAEHALEARFDAALIGEHLAVCGDLRGRIATPSVVTRDAVRRDAGSDGELPLAVQRDVGRIRRVVLSLIVAPATHARASVADVVSPLGGIDGVAGRSIELVAPHLYPRLR